MSTITKIAGRKYREDRSKRSAQKRMHRLLSQRAEAAWQQALNDHVYNTLRIMMRPDVRETCERLTWERQCKDFAQGKAA